MFKFEESIFMNIALKQEMRKLIDNCDDDILLEQAKELLQSKKDWWDELTEAQQIELSNLINEPDDKDIVSDEEFLKLTARWRTK